MSKPLKVPTTAGSTGARSLLSYICSLLVLAFVFPSASAQGLPGKIGGYKVHDEIITLSNINLAEQESPSITVGDPQVSNVSISGVTIAIAGELGAAGFDGRVERLMFRDFRINGIAVEVAELNEPFTIRKRGKTTLPAPASVFISTPSLISSAWKEITDSKVDWTVTGRIFVFGKFRRFGFNFKRVVPVDVRLTVKNPLVEYRKSPLS
jgi:hypothetical protein